MPKNKRHMTGLDGFFILAFLAFFSPLFYAFFNTFGTLSRWILGILKLNLAFTVIPDGYWLYPFISYTISYHSLPYKCVHRLVSTQTTFTPSSFIELPLEIKIKYIYPYCQDWPD